MMMKHYRKIVAGKYLLGRISWIIEANKTLLFSTKLNWNIHLAFWRSIKYYIDHFMHQLFTNYLDLNETIGSQLRTDMQGLFLYSVKFYSDINAALTFFTKYNEGESFVLPFNITTFLYTNILSCPDNCKLDKLNKLSVNFFSLWKLRII